VEDKNAPKNITIDYPEPPNGNNYIIMEKSFAQMKIAILNEQSQKLSATAAIGHSKKPALAAPSKDASSAAADDKKAQKTKELLT
jgi:hypothetical protein